MPLPGLEKDLHRVLHDVRVAVEDYPRMQAKATWLADRLAAEGASAPAETIALLRWLADNHFTFLGYREYDLVDEPDGMALRAVPGTGLGILRHDRPGSKSFARAAARGARPGQGAAAGSSSPRRTPGPPCTGRNYLDYIAVKRVDEAGQVNGEYRFLGLFTHAAYHESITRIPVLRRKLASVLEAAGLAADSHDGQDLTEILEGYPREELFQITPQELVPIALGVLALRERRQTRLFLRRDRYGRYMSCLVYLPRDRYTTAVRLRAQEVLRAGASAGWRWSTARPSATRRWPGCTSWCGPSRGTRLPEVNTAELEARLAAAVRSWDEDLAAAAHERLGEAEAKALLGICASAIPETYKTDVPALYALDDLTQIVRMLGTGEHGRVRDVGGRGVLRRGAGGGRPARPPAGLAADHLPDRVARSR